MIDFLNKGGVNSFDATAEATDIISGKTAYIKSGKVAGAMKTTYKNVEVAEYDSYTLPTVPMATLYKMYSVEAEGYLFIVFQENSDMRYVAIKDKNVVGENKITRAVLDISSNIGTMDINYSNRDGDTIYLTHAVGYNNGDGSSPVQYNRIAFNTRTNTFEKKGTRYTVNTLINNTGNNYGIVLCAVKSMPNVFVMYYSKWQDTTNVQLTKITWSDAGIASSVVRNYSDVFPYSYDYCRTIGDGTWFNHKRGIGKMYADATNFSRVTTTNVCFLSHNLKYMVMSNVLYKVDPSATTASALYNSRTEITSGLPSYINIMFSKDDNYMVLFNSTGLQILTFDDTGFNIVQTITQSGQRDLPFNTNFLIGAIAGAQLKLYDCSGEDILASIERNDIKLFNTSDATAVASNILEGKTAYAGGVKVTGTATFDNSISVSITNANLSVEGTTLVVTEPTTETGEGV